MTRRFLQITFSATALAIIAPAAFSAAVVNDGRVFIPTEAASGKTIQRRDIDRLFVGTRATVAATSFSLATQRAGSQLTLTGVNPLGSGSEMALPAVPNLADFDGHAFLADMTDVSPAPAAPVNIGSASSFAAVPEPSSIGLVAIGAIAFLRRRRG